MTATFPAASLVSTHEADMTNVHGIADTSVLATDAEVASAVATHEADTTSVHGIANTAVLATATSVATAVSNHEADTTSVHGIADTSALVVDGDAAGGVLSGMFPNPGFAADMATQAELNAHEADTTAVHGIADTSVLATATSVATAVSNHEADTTAVHGITDTSALALTADLSKVTANEQTANYTLVLADAGKVIEVNNASARTVTIPLNSSVAFPIGTVVEILRYGAGSATIVATGGVTIRSRSSLLAIGNQYGAASIRKRATDEWVLIGDLG